MKKYTKVAISLFLSAAISVPALASNKVQVRGSDTMVNLVQRMAEVYMEKNPGKYLAVTGGGSGNGIAGLRNRTADIANSSRKVRQREVIDMRNRGVDPVGVAIARDCITIIVNSENKVDRLTLDQLGAIYRGDITNWKDVGGDDRPITLYGRQSNSGTYVNFRELVVKGDYSFDMYRMNGNSQIVESLKTDRSGIGYVGLGYAQKADGLRIVRLAERSGEEYIDPTNRSDVEAGKYTLIRPIYHYVDGDISGDIRSFIEFELSPEGQKIVDKMGFLPVTEEEIKFNRESANI